MRGWGNWPATGEHKVYQLIGATCQRGEMGNMVEKAGKVKTVRTVE